MPELSAQSATGLKVSEVTRRYGRMSALDGVSLNVEPGELVALLGPSGSGKTTLLRTIAGLEPPDSGTVEVNGEDFLRLTPRQRRVGLVFQHYALFRHMTVEKNIGFGLRVRPPAERPAKKDIQARVDELLKLVQLDDLGRRYPAQLSGGQRQRVALARALAIEPRMLLLDEPFGALDAKVRKELRVWLRQLHDATGVTTLFVTHDQEEAMQIADRVAILNRGRIEQFARPDELEREPASRFVFEFLGDFNLLAGAVEGELARFGDFSAPAHNPGRVSGSAEVLFRPYETEFTTDAGHPVTVTSQAHQAGRTLVQARDHDGRAFSVLQAVDRPTPSVGSTARIKPLKAAVFA